MNQQTLKYDLTDTLRLSIPIVIAQLGVVLMGVTDSLFVGRMLGGVPLGAAGLATTLSFVITSIGLGALNVVSALISQANGRNDVTGIGRLFRAGLFVSVMMSVVLGLISAGLALRLDWFSQPPAVIALTKDFLLTLSLSIVPLFVFIAARQLCDGLRFPFVAMVITISALLFNALFNYLLIAGVGPFPRLGLQGAATATLLSRLYMAGAMLLYIFRAERFRVYLTPTIWRQPINDLVEQILRLGLPGGLTFFFEIATFSLAVIMMGWLGKEALAAHQIAISLVSITYMMATGISSAGAIRVGLAVGQGSREAVRRAGLAAFGLVIGFMGFCAVLFLSANELLVSLYIQDDPAVTSVAVVLVIIGGVFQLSDGMQAVGVGVLRGMADVNIPTWITLFAYWGVGLPLSYVLGFMLHWQSIGVWIGLLAGLTVAAVLLTTRFFRLIRQIDLSQIAHTDAIVSGH